MLGERAAEPPLANAAALENPEVWWAVPAGRGGGHRVSRSRYFHVSVLHISLLLHTSPESTKTQTPTDGGADGVRVQLPTKEETRKQNVFVIKT